MELVQRYNRLHKIERLHYITMESIINEVSDKFRGKPNTLNMRMMMKTLLEEHMTGRGLNRFFQLELSFIKYSVEIKVHEISRYNPPKECVIWNS
jgi:hypothetical protein